MKLECSVEKIKNAITLTERITNGNLTLPVLNSILFIASGKTLKLRSTNLSLGIEVEIPVKIESEGVLAVSGGALSNVFSNVFGSENVFLEEDNGNLSVKTKRSKMRLKGTAHEDFPTIPLVEGESFEIEAKKFIEGVKSVYYSSSVTDIKPEISSVYIYKNEEHLVFAATDSFRLAEKKIKIKKQFDLDGILLPYKNIPEIIRVIGDSNEPLFVKFNKNQISFSLPNVYITSRIVDGVFPDYRQIIPKEFKTEAVLLKQDLLSALKLSNTFSDKFNQLNLKIQVKNKIFELDSENSNVGDNKTELDAALTGEDVELSFNYKYFLECFTSLSSDSVVMKLNDSNKPMVIEPVSDKTFMYLIMPMNK
ncbi:MAG: DNA polymerase III subunit beta [Candidatus Paceibacterota bacterium]